MQRGCKQGTHKLLCRMSTSHERLQEQSSSSSSSATGHALLPMRRRTPSSSTRAGLWRMQRMSRSRWGAAAAARDGCCCFGMQLELGMLCVGA